MRAWDSQQDSGEAYSTILADWKAAMAKKSRNPNFDQTLETLRAHGFEVAAAAEVGGGALVSKYGAAAVLVAGAKDQGAAAFAVRPGVLARGQVARLLDRGYQKFIRTSQFELPATAPQLHAIHQFADELKLLIGAVSLYNEALGTTSDIYAYDRLQGREAEPAAPRRPWELAGGH